MTSQPPPGQYGYGPPPPPPPGQPYHPGPYYGYPPPRSTNTMAILALVFAFVFSPAAIVLGHIARKQIRETGEEGDGIALAGLIVGYIVTGLTVLFCVGYGIVWVVILGAFAASGTA